MTIQRQYSLPNCKLVLEGLTDATASADAARPLMSILVNAECHIAGYEKPLSGGREFLESLIAAVSGYAQEFLSGIHHPSDHGSKPLQVQIQRVGDHLHRLTVQPEGAHHTEPTDAAIAGHTTPTQIDLPTVQLFDLVEAIDQLFADTQTLPDLKRHLAPVSKRYVASAEPIAKRAAPAALGLSSLAAAAALLFFIPVPEVRQPEPTGSRSTEEESPAPSPSPVASPADSSPPDVAASPSPAVSPTVGSEASPDAASPAPVAEASPSPSPTAEAGGDPLEPAELDALLSRAPAVADANQVRALTLDLRDRLDNAWTQPPNFEDELIYRVGVAENGDILGFKYVNEASIDHVDKTPLLDLRYNPTDPAASPEPVVQMRVVFTPNGVVQVSPWNGYPQSTTP